MRFEIRDDSRLERLGRFVGVRNFEDEATKWRDICVQRAKDAIVLFIFIYLCDALPYSRRCKVVLIIKGFASGL